MDYGSAPMAGETRVVCISRAAAAGGEEIGWIVAQRLGLRYVDEEIIELAAEHANVASTVVAEVEAPKSIVRRVVEALDAIGSGTPPRSWSLRPSRKAVRTLIRGAIQEVADRGEAVIVAHAASMALGPRPGVLRVLVTGSPAVRAERLHHTGLPPKDAEASIAESDRGRQKYLEDFYGVADEHPTYYDLVINTDRLDVERAVAVVLASLGS